MLEHGREGGNRNRYMLSVSSTGQQQQQQAPPPTTTTIVPGVSSKGCSTNCFVKDGRKIRVGECALFKLVQDSPPFVGIIRSQTSDKESKVTVSVNWLYRPPEVKLVKGVSLEAEPNEVFYSFHRDEIPAASLLHPCKVAFLSRGAELPSGVSSFVCRRVYDFTNKCLWWLTDQDFIDERQVEVNKLLRKTQIEIHTSTKHPQGPRSPRPPNGSAVTSPQKHSPESVQNSSSNLSSQTKGKKKDRRDQSVEPLKREQNANPDEGRSGQVRSESLLNLEIGKIAEKGGLTDSEAVTRLICLLQLDKYQGKIDLRGRSILAGIIAATEKLEYLNQFVQLKGLVVFDEWLQEVHKGKIGESGKVKDSDKSLKDFLLVLLQALDKLPVNLNALQMCHIGKSVNHLRSHKNSEIQKKARSLVDTWKKRVEAEMSVNDGKVGSTQAVPRPSKSRDGSHGAHHSSLDSSTVKGESNLTSGCGYQNNAISELSPVSIKINGKLERSRISSNRGISEPLQTVVMEENSCGSSQPHVNNRCSSDQIKCVVPCGKEDARRSTADSKSLNKTTGNGFRNKKSAKSRTSGVHRETASNLSILMARTSLHEKVSPNGIDDSIHLTNIHEENNNKLIVKIPNKLSQSIVAASTDDSSGRNIGSPSLVLPVGRAQLDAWSLGMHHSLQSSEVDGSSAAQNQIPTETGRLSDVSKTTCSSAMNEMNLKKAHDSSFNHLDALIECCIKFSEANLSMSPGDDIGINLLASVAVGEFPKSDIDLSNICLDRPSSTADQDLNICSDVSNINDGESTEGIANGRLRDNMISDEPVIISCSTQRSATDSCAVVPSEKCGDGKDGHNPDFAASKSVANHMEGEDKMMGAPIMDVSENTTLSTACPSITVDVVETNAFVYAEHNCPTEHMSCTESLQPRNIDGMQGILSSTSQDTVAVNTDTVFKNTMDVELVDNANEDDKRRLAQEFVPTQMCRNQEDVVVDCADVNMDTDGKDAVLEHKEGLVQKSGSSGVQCSTAAVLPDYLMSTTKGDKLNAIRVETRDDAHADVTVNAASPAALGGSHWNTQLPFDLNDGLNMDNGKNLVLSEPNGLRMSVTVTSAAKGAFVPPDDLLRTKKELGWKGSAATSAFRPAEPRKVVGLPLVPNEAPRPDSAACKLARQPLNIDLNVADECSEQESNDKNDSTCEPVTSSRSFGGFDLDLNKVDEGSDMVEISTESSPSVNALTSRIFSNGEASCKRDFDLNNGPAIEEIPVEPTSYTQPVSSNISLQSAYEPRFINNDTRNVYTCNPPGTSYSRESFPGVGLHRTIGGPLSSLPFSTDAYGGSVLASSPSINLQSGLFQYPAFSFAGANHLPACVMAGGPSGFMDPSSGGRISAIPSQISFQYPQAYIVPRPLPDFNSGKWGNQGLDLNSGPGVINLKGRDGLMPDASRQVSAISSQPLVEDQTRMYNMGGGGIRKRREPDGGLSMDSFNFKHSRQR